MSPIELYFTPEGVESTQSIKLENPTKEPIAVKIEAFKRSHELDGKENRTPTKDFLIYPIQTILKPGETKSARITWLGKSNGKKRSTKITKEEAYRLNVTQLPVDVRSEKKKVQKPKTGIKMVYQYVASLYVRKRSFKPKLEVDGVVKNSDGQVELIFHNTGSMHTLIKRYDIKQRVNNKSIFKKIPDLSDTVLTKNILAGEKLKIAVPVNSQSRLERSNFVLEKKKN